jgi:hypothetical protein
MHRSGQGRARAERGARGGRDRLEKRGHAREWEGSAPPAPLRHTPNCGLAQTRAWHLNLEASPPPSRSAHRDACKSRCRRHGGPFPLPELCNPRLSRTSPPLCAQDGGHEGQCPCRALEATCKAVRSRGRGGCVRRQKGECGHGKGYRPAVASPSAREGGVHAGRDPEAGRATPLLLT